MGSNEREEQSVGGERYICRIRDELCIRKANGFTGQEELFFFSGRRKELNRCCCM